MYYSLMLILSVASAAMLGILTAALGELADRKRECERLQKSLAAKDDIEMKQMEVIHSLTKELAELNRAIEKWLENVEKEGGVQQSYS